MPKPLSPSLGSLQRGKSLVQLRGARIGVWIHEVWSLALLCTPLKAERTFSLCERAGQKQAQQDLFAISIQPWGARRLWRSDFPFHTPGMLALAESVHAQDPKGTPETPPESPSS